MSSILEATIPVLHSQGFGDEVVVGAPRGGPDASTFCAILLVATFRDSMGQIVVLCSGGGVLDAGFGSISRFWCGLSRRDMKPSYLFCFF